MAHPRILSVGSGAGVLDVPVFEHLQRAGPLSYTGIDCNRIGNEICRAAMAEAAGMGSDVDIIDGLIEEFDTAEPFDFVTGTHCFYYSSNLTETLRQCLRLMRPNGHFLALAAPDNRLSSFFEEISPQLSGHEVGLSDRLTRTLKRLGMYTQTTRIHAQADITPLADPDDDTGHLLLDFILHADTRACPRHIRERLRQRVLDICSIKHGRVILPHDVEGIVGTRMHNRSGFGQSVELN